MIAFVFAFLFFASSTVFAQVTFQATSADNSGTALSDTMTISVTVSAGDDLYLVSGFSTGCNTACPNDAVTVTFNGDAMSSVETVSEGGVKTWIYEQVNPDVGTFNLVINPSNDQRMAGGAVVFTNVDQSDPSGTTGELNCENTTTCSCSVTVPANGAGFGTGGKQDSTEAHTVDTQDARWTSECSTSGTASANRCSSGATTTSAGSQTFTFGSSVARNLTCAAVPLNVASAAVVVRPLGVTWFGQ